MKNLYFIIILFSFSGIAQQEMANWHFGSKAALNFQNGCPSPFSDSELDTIESSTSMSSSDGDLLFYTDGVTVYNRNNLIMANGQDLLGALSSTNGVIIIPFPNNSQRYYIFTADAVQNYQSQGEGIGVGINYSVVDMNGSGGLGSVIEKNINILPQGSEKLTAVRNANNDGYWLLTHYQNSFYAYPITSSGVGTPVITTLGISINSFNNIRGAIKFSPDGTRVAVCHSLFEPSLSGSLSLFDFNDATGVLSNEQVLGEDIVYYGVEFSPNSEVLYTTGKIPINNGFDTGNTQFFQYDLLAPNIINSRYEIANYLSSPFINLAGSIQTALDGKVYHSLGGLNLSVVRKPNRLGADSDFLFRAVSLGISTSSIGLPIGMQTYYDNIVEYDNLCNGDTTSFSLNTSKDIVSVSWNFGDPGSGPNNTSSLENPTHVFSAIGSYTVTTTVLFGNGEMQTYYTTVKSAFTPDLVPATLVQCDVEGENDGRTFFNLFDAIDILIPQDSNSDSGFLLNFYETEMDAILETNPIPDPQSYFNEFNGQVVYTSIFQSLDCFQVTSIILDVDPGMDIPDLDVTVCASSFGNMSAVVLVNSILDSLLSFYPDDVIRLYSTIQDAGLQQNEIVNSELFEFNEENFVFFRLGNSNECIGIGKLNLTILEPLVVEDQNVTLCPSDGDSFISGPPGYESYEWNTGDVGRDLEIVLPGIYILEATLFPGCSVFIQYNVTEGSELEIEIAVNDFQQNNTISINATTSEGVLFYSIDGGETFVTSDTFSNLSPGIYEVVVMDETGCSTITETVFIRGAPKFFTPNDDGFNDVWHIIDAENYEGMEVEIFDRYGKKMASLTDTSMGWDGTYNGKQLATNTYWYSVKYNGEVNYGYFTLIVRNL